MKKLFLLIVLSFSLPCFAFAESDLGQVRSENGTLHIMFVSTCAYSRNGVNNVSDPVLNSLMKDWLLDHPGAYLVKIQLSESAAADSREVRIMIVYREK